MKTQKKRARAARKEIVVIAHDAGGAEVIAAYLKKYEAKFDIRAYVAGPAERVFKREHIPARKVPADRLGISRILEKHIEASFLLTGSGWMTKIEPTAVVEAKKIGIPAFTYLDSWSRYPVRFGHPVKNWRKNLPDELWVGDRFAGDIARKTFPHTKVRLQPNQYFANIKERFISRKKRAPSTKVLFLSDAVPGMERVLGGLLQGLEEARHPHPVLVRLHPADDKHRYDKVIDASRGKVHVVVSKEKDIVADLRHARSVVGTETVALVAAVLVGKRTISIRTPGKKPQLPFPKIVRVKNIKEALRLI